MNQAPDVYECRPLPWTRGEHLRRALFAVFVLGSTWKTWRDGGLAMIHGNWIELIFLSPFIAFPGFLALGLWVGLWRENRCTVYLFDADGLSVIDGWWRPHRRLYAWSKFAPGTEIVEGDAAGQGALILRAREVPQKPVPWWQFEAPVYTFGIRGPGWIGPSPPQLTLEDLPDVEAAKCAFLAWKNHNPENP